MKKAPFHASLLENGLNKFQFETIEVIIYNLWNLKVFNSNLMNHLSVKQEGSLFCFVGTRSTKLGCFRSCSWCLCKALDDEGCMGLVPWCLDLRWKSSWTLNDFFTENLRGIIEMCLWCCWKALDDQDLMEFVW